MHHIGVQAESRSEQMRYLKVIGLVAAVSILMAWAGPSVASATELDGSAGTLPAGTVIHFRQGSGGVIMHPAIGSITCGSSTISAKTANAGSPTETVKADLENLSFTECNSVVTVLKKGTFEFHTDPTDSGGTSGSGTVTWSGMELTTSFSGFHCIFATSHTDFGRITGSKVTKEEARLDITATIPRTGGSSGIFCGSTAAWTGSYEVLSPSTLNIT